MMILDCLGSQEERHLQVKLLIFFFLYLLSLWQHSVVKDDLIDVTSKYLQLSGSWSATSMVWLHLGNSKNSVSKEQDCLQNEEKPALSFL